VVHCSESAIRRKYGDGRGHG
jgi:hypothetical protein